MWSTFAENERWAFKRNVGLRIDRKLINIKSMVELRFLHTNKLQK